MPAFAQKDDYFYSIARTEVRRWQQAHFPLKVFIPVDAEASGIRGYRPEFRTTLKDAFQTWETASGKQVSFQFVDALAKADIDCLWSADTTGLRSPWEAGDTRIKDNGKNNDIQHATITIVTTKDSDRKLPNTVNHVHNVALHEIAHALGLVGHSPNEADILYFGEKPNAQTARTLSARDLRTLAHLYQTDAVSLAGTVAKLDADGQSLVEHKHFAEAQSKFDAALKYDRSSSQVLSHKASCLIDEAQSLVRNGHDKEAVPILVAASDLPAAALTASMRIEIERDLAESYRRLGEYPAAIAVLRRLVWDCKRHGRPAEARAAEASLADLNSQGH
jgi:predicted Zn-dependent protease